MHFFQWNFLKPFNYVSCQLLKIELNRMLKLIFTPFTAKIVKQLTDKKVCLPRSLKNQDEGNSWLNEVSLWSKTCSLLAVFLLFGLYCQGLFASQWTKPALGVVCRSNFGQICCRKITRTQEEDKGYHRAGHQRTTHVVIYKEAQNADSLKDG